ncbi:MAG TPA: hypothetical protein HPQ04_16015 [Rhodospirillaceae bacterium]|nr:hypothetical protein [Rhodospirillaceae bacterium]
MLVLLALPWAAEAAHCPPAPAGATNPTVRLEVAEPKLIYRHDVDLLGLARVPDTFESAAKGWVLLGLTKRNDTFSVTAKVLMLPAVGGGGTCVWVEEVSARLGGNETDVYVASNYHVGSCEYNVVLEHENTHVAINREVLKAFAPRIGAGLREALRGFPVVVAEAGEAGRVPGLLSASVNQVYQSMIGELRRRNQALDSPENYRRTQMRCHNWFPPGTSLPAQRR